MLDCHQDLFKQTVISTKDGEVYLIQHLCDQVCQCLATGIPFSFPNKTDRHNITEILSKVNLFQGKYTCILKCT